MMLEESLAAFPDPVVRSSAQGGTTWKNAHFIESYATILFFFSRLLEYNRFHFELSSSSSRRV